MAENLSSATQNFASAASGGVDPRTGLYHFNVTVPMAPANDLAGPDFSLVLSFSPLGNDDWGYGQGWAPNLSRLHTTAPRTLALSTGERFAIGAQTGGEPQVFQSHLKSFRLFRDDSQHARVVHRDGRVEHLSSPGFGEYLVPTVIEGPNGRWIALEYTPDNGRARLVRIVDEYATELLRLAKAGSDLLLHVPSETEDFYYRMAFQGGRLHTLTLPPSIGGQWAFSYYDNANYPTISQVQQPLGAIEQMLYHGVHKVPGGRPDLPRVTQYTLLPTPGAEPVVQAFSYSAQEKNFLGYNEITSWPADGTEPLYKVRSDYQYSTTIRQQHAGKTRTVQRTYNRFHLPLSEVTQQGDCTFTRTTDYGDLTGKNFDELPGTFQLAKKLTSRWHQPATPERPEQAREETTRTEYDEHGNVTLQVEPSGVQTAFTYYAATGEDGCPADPWGFVRHIKASTRSPAPAAPEQHIDGGGVVEVTEYRYTALPLPALAQKQLTRQVPGAQATSNYLLVEQVNTLVQSADGTQLASQAVDYTYHADATDRVSFGRLDARTARYNGHSSTQSNRYERLDGRLKTTVEQTNSDGTTTTTVVQQCLLTARTLAAEDALGVATASRYDGLGRLLALTIAPGDKEIEATRRFSYSLYTPPAGTVPYVLAEHTETSAAGVCRRVKVDGLGRPLERHLDEGWGEAASSTCEWEGRYNALGQLEEETEYDNVDSSGPARALTTTHEYDDWGQRCASTGPDGVRRVSATSPFGAAGPVVRSWRQAAGGDESATDGVTETEYNAFGKAAVTSTYDASGTLAEKRTYHYDGLGQLLREVQWYSVWLDDGSDYGERTTAYSYDAWGRTQLITLANGDLVGQGYPEHTPQAMLATLSHGRNANALTELASRGFDQLGRVTQTTIGKRTVAYRYSGAHPAPEEITLADGSLLGYTYRPALSQGPQTLSANNQHYSFGYDSVTGRLQRAGPQASHQGQAAAIDCTYGYNRLGQLIEETREGSTYTSTYGHSVQGRRLWREDSGMGRSLWAYDGAGRLERHSANGTVASQGYDRFGRVAEQLCAGVQVKLTYDGLGREAEREHLEAASGNTLRKQVLHWHGDGTLAGRDTYSGASTAPALSERFSYDRRNRLQAHTCSGEPAWLPRDRFGAAYTSQVFMLDTLDNVVRLVTTLAEGGASVSAFSYSASDPCQLASATHTQPNKPTLQETFSYDANGQMTGRTLDNATTTLEYDSLGRLAALTDAAGRSTYHYDPHGSLCAVEHGGQRQARFYEGYRLDHTREGSGQQRYLSTAGTPLALLDGSGEASALLSDSAGSVTGQWQANRLSRAVYSAYGSHHQAEGSASHALGFNGEPRDAARDAYLLGRGYRLYLPGLMSFNRPDSESPFGAGGLNPYRYAQGNPIMLHDPSGHAPMPIWTAANLPYYIAPEKPAEGGGGLLGSLFNMLTLGFIAWEAVSVVQMIIGVVTAPLGGAALALAGSAAVAAAALGTGIASLVDPDNDALMWVSIGLGIGSMAVSKGVEKAIGGAGKAGARRASSTADVGSRRSSVSAVELSDEVAASVSSRSSVSGASVSRRASNASQVSQGQALDSAEDLLEGHFRTVKVVVEPPPRSPTPSVDYSRSSISSSGSGTSNYSTAPLPPPSPPKQPLANTGQARSPYMDAAARAVRNENGPSPIHVASATLDPAVVRG
ncbi:RHS repeat-associated core domain-containing protein [Pseudomonas sp. NPDC007930]|uniref:RHS repeat domain-containing protein n=1 Tax=Pseudomonas sp. NPDC007930 TaxID=3364417 RepID=UPI0036E5D0EC